MSMLHYTARSGSLAACHFLSRHQPATVNQIDRVTKAKFTSKLKTDNFAPLHYAAAYGHYEICELLIAHGAVLEPEVKRVDIRSLHLIHRGKPL